MSQQKPMLNRVSSLPSNRKQKFMTIQSTERKLPTPISETYMSQARQSASISRKD